MNTKTDIRSKPAVPKRFRATDRLVPVAPALHYKKHSSEQRFAQPAKTKLNSVALVRERTLPTERLPLVDEVIVNVCG
jgi:hypothetical protein